MGNCCILKSVATSTWKVWVWDVQTNRLFCQDNKYHAEQNWIKNGGTCSSKVRLIIVARIRMIEDRFEIFTSKPCCHCTKRLHHIARQLKSKRGQTLMIRYIDHDFRLTKAMKVSDLSEGKLCGRYLKYSNNQMG